MPTFTSRYLGVQSRHGRRQYCSLPYQPGQAARMILVHMWARPDVWTRNRSA